MTFPRRRLSFFFKNETVLIFTLPENISIFQKTGNSSLNLWDYHVKRKQSTASALLFSLDYVFCQPGISEALLGRERSFTQERIQAVQNGLKYGSPPHHIYYHAPPKGALWLFAFSVERNRLHHSYLGNWGPSIKNVMFISKSRSIPNMLSFLCLPIPILTSEVIQENNPSIHYTP